MLEDEQMSKIMTISNGKNALGSFAIPLVLIAFYLVGGYMVIKRTLDVVFLTLMGWFYCGESISSNPNNGAFATFGRKLLSICLTQFFVIIEIGIFSFFAANSPERSFMFNISISIAWIAFLLGTPTFIADICHDTGTAGDLMRAYRLGKGLHNMLSNK